jgi:methylenetetrahydrofolate reductase (NADPH)
MRRLGVSFAIGQCEDLIRNGVRYIHFYSMNRSDSMKEIMSIISTKTTPF